MFQTKIYKVLKIVSCFYLTKIKKVVLEMFVLDVLFTSSV